MMILMSNKVRSRMPEVPPEADSEPDQVKRGRGRPVGSLTDRGSAKLIYEEMAGVKLSVFKNIPVELLNRLVGTISGTFSKLARVLDAAYRDGIDERLPDIAEHVLPEVVYELGRCSMEEILLQQRGFFGTHLQCHHDQCVESLEYQGDVEKEIKTKLGAVKVKRAYYHGKCGHSACPMDIQLGVDGKHSALPSLQEAIGLLGATLSYPEAVRLIEVLLPCKLSLKGVETITATIAGEVQERQQAEVEQVMAEPSKAALGSIVEGVAVISADGGFAKVRDHSEKTREFKLAVLGTPVSPNPATPATATTNDVPAPIKLENKSFVGRMTDPDTFFEQVTAEYFRIGFHRMKTLHGVADGADWILPRIANLAQEGQTLSLVLDWFHATERLADAAKLAHGGVTTAEGKAWQAQLRELLWNDDIDAFLEALRQSVKSAKPESQEELTGHLHYFEKRRHLLRYKECREKGLPIGSGMVEGGVRFVGKDRLDRTGMRWNVASAEAMIQLRCAKYSGRLSEYAETKARERAARYKSCKSFWGLAS